MTDCKHDWHFTSDGTMAMRCKKCGQETGPRSAEQLAQDMMQDALTIGSAWSKGGKRIDPASVFKDHGAIHSCSYHCDRPECIKAQRDELRERLAQDFIKHEVDSASDWSEWVCPDPEQYFMKCCDCGLVHKMQFKVVKYSEGDECEPFNDPNVQVVFRARRTTPPAAQPEQEPRHIVQSNGRHSPLLTHMMNSRTTPPPPQRQPLTEEEIMQTWEGVIKYAPGEVRLKDFARAIEAAHGIGGKA